MATSPTIGTQEPRIACETVARARNVPTLIDDVEAGLLTAPRVLPPKYFYDEYGSKLFDRICETAEYYVTRTEDALLKECSAAIIDQAAPDDILELGSGTSRKTRRLLDACETLGFCPTYSPYDISEEILHETALGLVDDYDWLEVNILIGDYEGGLEHLPKSHGRRLFCFLGSTIGNFQHDKAIAFLRDIRGRMNRDDLLLLGADRVKDGKVLHAAYNDSGGLTAAFNLNLLKVLNEEVEADFDLDRFEHRALFNEDESRIEMHLVSRADQTIRIGALDAAIRVSAGESILTEISRKFTDESLTDMLRMAGFSMAAHFTPDDEYFSLILARPQSA